MNIHPTKRTKAHKKTTSWCHVMTPNNANIPKDRISQQHLIGLCIHQKFHLGLGKYGIYHINTRQNSKFGKELKG